MNRETFPPARLRNSENRAAPIRLLQITDCHLYASPERRLAGLQTQQTFDAVLELARKEFHTTDLVLATGDLVHDASAEGYRRLRERFESIGRPVYCLPGNHDIPEVMGRIMNRGNVTSPESVRHGNWIIILLDSTVAGREGGHLRADQLERLERNLEAHAECHAMITLHHHPAPIGSAWMDRMALDNPTDFFRIVDRYPRIRAIVCGHIHQEFDSYYRHVRLLGAPSTCVQFTPRLDQFSLDVAPPGLRWLELGADGSVDTGIHRLTTVPEELDISVGGY
jgi:Icc protein